MSDNEERLVSAIEGAANFMRGMTMDPRIVGEIKDALESKIRELEDLAEEFTS